MTVELRGKGAASLKCVAVLCENKVCLPKPRCEMSRSGLNDRLVALL